MKVSKDARTPEEFRKFAERMSKYFDLRGCRTEKCINNRIKKSAKSKKLLTLVKHRFAFRLLIEAHENPHPVYKKILGMDNKECNIMIKTKRKADKEFKKSRINTNYNYSIIYY